MTLSEFCKNIQIQDKNGKYHKFKPNKIQKKLIEVIDYAREHNMHLELAMGRKGNEFDELQTILKLVEKEKEKENDK